MLHKTFIRLFIVLSGVYASCTNPKDKLPEASDEAILIHHANIINVVDGSIAQNQAILIDSAAIRAIGAYDDLKSIVVAGRHFDVGSRYVIPGLWDMHVHIEGADLVEDNQALLPVYVAYGITTVRDAASDLGKQVLAWRDAIKQGKLFGPHIFTAGRKLEGVNSIWKGDLEIANEQELHQMLDTLEADKVDFVKITENTLTGPLFLASVKAAKARGFKVSGHVPYDLTIQQLAEAGFSSIEHASYLLRLGSDEQKTVDQITSGKLTKKQADQNYLSYFDQDKANEAYEAIAKSKVAVTPTLIGGKQLAYLDEDDHQNDAFLQYLTQRFTDNYQWRIDRMADETPKEKQQRKDRYQRIVQQLPYVQKAGILILAGSDAAALNTYVYPALSLHQELVLFQQAGLTPLQILQSATINGAKFMEKLDTMATIEEAKMADMVILNANPLQDIKATQDIHAVVYQGQYFDRAALDSILQQARQKRIALDNKRKN